MVPKEAARAIRERSDFSVERIHEIEAEVRHDVIAFTTAGQRSSVHMRAWFHYGLTSNDVVDTAQALLIKQASALIAQDLERLAEVLERRAWEFKDTPMVGRTHGIHRRTHSPSGSSWRTGTPRCSEISHASKLLPRTCAWESFPGAVGIFAHLTPENRGEDFALAWV